jgi:hypothetical protein
MKGATDKVLTERATPAVFLLFMRELFATVGSGR